MVLGGAHRTKAERRVDGLGAELRKLRAVPCPSREQRARMFAIETDELPKAWRAVRMVRAR